MSNEYTGGLIYNAPGGWSALFSGSNYLSTPGNTAFDFGSGNFTVEAWLYRTTTGGFTVVSDSQYWYAFSLRVNSSGAVFSYGFASSTSSQIWYCTSANNVVPVNAWCHLALVRNGSSVVVYLNGTNVANTTAAGSAGTTSSIRVAFNDAGVEGTGYVSNVRIVKGTAVYTSSFTPPNGALQAISGTSLLTCRYPTIVDGSSNGFTITNTGAVAVNTLNPFPTSALPNPALGGAGNGIYTMTQYSALRTAGLWPSYDPYYRNVALNLHGNGTNGAQNNTFLDSSTNNFTITRNGNTTQGAFSPYGDNWSFCADANSQSASVPYNAALNLVSGTSFTVEAWIFPTTDQTTDLRDIVGKWSGPGCFKGNFRVSLSGNDLFSTGYNKLCFFTATNPDQFTGSVASIPLNTWTHFAWVYDGGTNLTLYLNGVLDSVFTAFSISNNLNTSLVIGTNTNQFFRGNHYQGYISNLRIVKGSQVYTSEFTPPTVPLTAIPNTVLLTCQNSRWKDNSSNNFTVTPSNAKISRFSPFSPTTAYTTSVIGGSGYFDGNGDFLSLTGSSATNFSGVNWTVETWVYSIGAPPADYTYIIQSQTGTNNWLPYFGIGLMVNGRINCALNAANYTTTQTIGFNAWNHLALVRSGGVVKLYINGVASSVSVTLDVVNSDLSFWFGKVDNSPGGGSYIYYLNGYMASTRFVKGTAVYTSNFTPPTLPLTAITNTQLLLSYTNAGIIDNAMVADLETVGNAQISTSVVKYGSGSMYFDGTDDRLTMAANPNFIFGTGDFTVEFWMNSNNVSTQQKGILQTSDTVGGLKAGYTTGIALLQGGNATGGPLAGGLTFNVAGTNLGTSAAVITTGVWYHIALVRLSGVSRIYVNGISVASATTTGNCSGQNLCVGGYYDTTYLYNGYLDDFRITKGVARYTANFTPPTSQVQDQ